MAATVQTQVAFLNRAIKGADATAADFATQVAALTANQMSGADAFDIPTLSDAALAKLVLTNMGLLPTTVAGIAALEPALTDYFATAGKGHRGFVVMQLSQILSDLANDITSANGIIYNAAGKAWNTTVAASVATSAPGTYALTTSTTDNLKGGLADDIFTSITSALASANTLNATDKIDGGAGNDTLKVDIGTNFAGFTTGSVTNVETLSLNNVSNSDRTFDATGVTGVTTLTVDATNGSVSSVANLGTGVKTINLTNQTGSTTGGNSAAFATSFATGSAEIAGTSDSVALNLNNVGGTATAGKGTVTLNLGSFENVNIASTGANVISLANTAGIKAVTVTGAGSLNLTAIPAGATLTTFDASAATGAVTAVLSAATGQVLKTIATGSGADAVTIEAKDVVANATISGGAGTDTLTIGDSTGVTAVEYNLSGFETVAFSGSGNLLFSGTKTTDVTTVSSNKTATVTTGDVTLVNMGAGNLTVQSKGAAANNLSTDGTGSATVNYSATVAASTTSSSDANSATFTADSASTLTVGVGAYVAQSGAISAAKATSVALTVASGKDVGGTERTSFGSTITAAKATSFTVTADGTLAAAATINAAIATSGTVTNGTSAGTLALTTPKLTSLNVTTGSGLTLNPAGTDLSGLQSLTLAANAGTTALGALGKISSLTLSGTGAVTGNLSTITTGNLGGANDYSLSLTATGLKGGLTVGTLNVNPGYDVSINTSGMTGDFTDTSIGATTVGRNVTITAAGSTGALTTGNVSGTGAVSIDATGTKSATIGTVTGDSVTVYESGTTNASSVGTITAKSAVDLKLYELQANTQTINANTGATGLTVKLAGGVLADNITISNNGVTTLKTVTVTGNLGASTDSLTLNTATGASGQTLDISGLVSYDSATITAGSGADTIVGGAGDDTIRGGAGADTMTGGAGNNKFVFAQGDSPYFAFDTITDLKATDTVLYDGANVTKAAQNVAADATHATISTAGIATFENTAAANKDTLAKVVALIDASVTTEGGMALFAFGGDTYGFIDTGANTNDIVIKLVGVSTTTVALAAGATGLTGFGS